MKNIKSVHCIGIGGIGVSALARLFLQNGATVTGSDMHESELTNELTKEGISVVIGHDVQNLPEECELCIFSPAIPENNPELESAREKGVQCMSYPEALGELSKSHTTIAIAGTHGKSTTTGLLTQILLETDVDPTIIIGTKLPALDNKNVRPGKSEYLIVEACEYHGGFLHLAPDILVITNIEHDHFDAYPTEDAYIEAYTSLAKKVPSNGTLIIKKDQKHAEKILQNLSCSVIEYGDEPDKSLQIIGDFNQENAKAAAAAARTIGIEDSHIDTGLQKYAGSWRRLEYKGEYNGAKIYDDYAHHPTAIRATLKALREKYPESKICCVFQPHQFNRTRHLLKDFAKSFKHIDHVIIPNIYGVRDTKHDREAVSAEALVSAIQSETSNAEYGGGIAQTAKSLQEKTYDVIIIMGAGDVIEITKMLIHDAT